MKDLIKINWATIIHIYCFKCYHYIFRLFDNQKTELITLILMIGFFSCKHSEVNEASKVQLSHHYDIAFVTDRDGYSEIYVMDKDGGNLKNITNHDSLDFSPSWSKTNSKLFFYSKRDGNPEIYSIGLNDNKTDRLTSHPSTDVLPTSSPDGKLIAFMSNRDSKSRNVYIMEKDGSNVKQLTQNNSYEESPDWSPDGNKIIFTRQLRDETDTSHAANGEIHIMNMDGSDVKRLTFKEGYDSGAKFSPDGKKIAFYGSQNNLWDLYVMNSDGNDVINVTSDSIECYSPDWSPDGEWLVYTAGTRGNYNIWKIHIKSKERVQLTNTKGRNESPVWKK